MTDPIRIIIADDHPIVRKGLRQTIEAEPTLQVVAEAENGQEALAQIEALQPAVAVLDIDMPKLDGISVARELSKRRQPPAIIFLTIHNDEDLFNEAMDLGAKGYLLKDSAVIDVVAGIKAVAAGQHYITPSIAGYLIKHREQANHLAERVPGLKLLTATELRILRMIAEYMTSKEIGEQLFISHRTVENHRTNICQKLDIHGSNALLKFAVKHKSQI